MHSNGMILKSSNCQAHVNQIHCIVLCTKALCPSGEFFFPALPCAVACRHGKRIPRRSFRRFAFVGLDMVPNHGTHASGAGNHISGFTDSVERDTRVRLGWKTFYEAAAARGSRMVNLSPGTGLMEIPRIEPPERWLVS